jgi:DNA modification methylase
MGCGIKEKHFAAFPIELPRLCILSGSRPGDLVLDPFMGAGTTAIAASQEGRGFIGFELNADYTAIANKRLQEHLGMFLPGPGDHHLPPPAG